MTTIIAFASYTEVYKRDKNSVKTARIQLAGQAPVTSSPKKKKKEKTIDVNV